MAAPANTCAHQILLYDSIEELLACVVPFLHDGLADGDAVVLAVNPHEELPILRALNDASRIRLIGNQAYTSAETAVDVMTAFLDQLVAAGATHIRIAGALPSGYAKDWAQWQEYERTMNA